LHSLDAIEVSDSLSSIEVLAVDNGSTDGTRDFLLEEARKKRRFRFLRFEEPQRGKARALNLGLLNAQGDYLFFVDDDVVASPQCLMGHLDCYHKTGFHALQGRILPGLDPKGRSADPKRLREYNIPIVDYGEEIKEIRGLTGTNMSFKREVFHRVGLFNVHLGPGAAGFSEDTEYSMRIRRAGFKIGYAPHAIVYHELNPERYGRIYNREVQYRKGLSRSIYRRDSIVLHVLPNLLANCIRLGFYSALGKGQKAYKTEGRILKSWGYLAGRVGRLMARFTRP